MSPATGMTIWTMAMMTALAIAWRTGHLGRWWNESYGKWLRSSYVRLLQKATGRRLLTSEQMSRISPARIAALEADCGLVEAPPPIRIEPPETYHVRVAFDSNPRLGVQRAPLRISHRKKAELPPEVNRDQLAEALTQIADHSSDGDIRDHLRTVIRALNGSGVLFVNGPAQQVMRET